jgi:hypothetical protein
MLARISGQVKALQKYRDDCAKALGYDHNPDRIREETQTALDITTEAFTSEIGESAKHPDIPHRNLLPNPADLFHYSSHDPDYRSGPSFLDCLKLLHERSSAPKPKLPDPPAK